MRSVMGLIEAGLAPVVDPSEADCRLQGPNVVRERLLMVVWPPKIPSGTGLQKEVENGSMFADEVAVRPSSLTRNEARQGKG